MNKSNNNSLRVFFCWWAEQLFSFIPAPLKTIIDKNTDTIEIKVMDDEWILYNKINNYDFSNRASINTNNTQRVELLKSWIAEISDPPSRLKIKIPSDHYLLKEIELPIAAEATLHEAIEFQIGRITPFRLEDVYYHYGIIKKDRTKKILKTWIAVIPKRKIDTLLTAFDEQSPQPSTPLYLDDSNHTKTGTFVISYRLHTEEKEKNWLTTAAIAMLLINLLALAIYANIHLNNQLIETDAIHTQLNEVKNNAMEAMDIEQQLEELEQQASFIGNLDQDAMMKVAIIDDLTKIIPDHTWIKQLDIKDGQLTLMGYSDNSAGLIGQLEKSLFLNNVGFKSTIIQDRISGKERFSLSAQLVKPEMSKTDDSVRDTNKDETTDRPPR